MNLLVPNTQIGNPLNIIETYKNSIACKCHVKFIFKTFLSQEVMSYHVHVGKTLLD